MLSAYRQTGGTLTRLAPDEPIDSALWIDLLTPDAAETAAVAALGHAVPALGDMQEIELSNRLYRKGDADYMTVVLPGRSEDGAPAYGPVGFVLTKTRLVTVRHHAARPFETFPRRAASSSAGCGDAGRLFLGLVEEIIGRLADLLEAIGMVLDDLSARVFGGSAGSVSDGLREVLQQIGRQGEMLGRVRLGLLTVGRALNFHDQTLGADDSVLHGIVSGVLRDIEALNEHADFLSERISLIDDATLGMINLQQNATVRIVSVVAVLFLPPTLVASIYGMNFRVMPKLTSSWGYPGALLAMVASAVATFLFFRWRGWL